MNDAQRGASPRSASTPVVVVGGGVGGLVVARELARSCIRVTLLEASDRLGGQVRRLTLAGLDLDVGAEAFATKSTTVADLARELGLEADIVAPAPLRAWLQPVTGAARPLPSTGLLGIPSKPLARDVIASVGIFGAARAAVDRVMPRRVGADAESLGDLVRIRMGAAVHDRLVSPVVTGVHSASPAELSVDRAAPGLRAALLRSGSLSRAVGELRRAAPAGAAVAGIRGGIARLVDSLELELHALGVDVRLGAAVESVSPDGVQLAGGEHVAGRVVVAAPGMLGPSPTRPAVVAVLVLRSAQLDAAPRGTGLLVAPGAPGIRARALTHQTAKWPWLAERAAGQGEGLHVVRLSYAGADADLPTIALRDASTLLGVRLTASDLVESAIVTWQRAAVSESPVPEGVLLVGETAAGGGLAAVVAHARRTARELAHDIAGETAEGAPRRLGQG
ncbi:protoporphyrinogen/coproporphyrinogen oxidase [Ruicaihuangia caeni]|uniref:FAD-dependent oxidoreductase n=1 Tax=Ruicaihuangia caeni TaxID=3042517 RepID=A0AAW6T501_9MICO|nr:FAD-dependent oxidoreductase [Klugiella sp. YN-L-19]MDI2098349.1 FAD-dependent oxidoreductase [Klugiella sp. YN-L-19]